MSAAAPALTLIRPSKQAQTAPCDVERADGAGDARTGAATAPETQTASGEHRRLTPLGAGDGDLLRHLAPSLALAVTEVLFGLRAHTTIEKWVEPTLLERIRDHAAVRSALAARRGRTDAPLGIRSLRLCPLSDSTVEAAAVVASRMRPRGVGMRFERHRERWRLTEFVSV